MKFSASGLVKSVITNVHPPMPPETKKLIFREGPRERLAEFLGDRPGCCLKLGGQAVTILPFLESQHSDKHQGFCGTAGHLGFQCHTCPDCPGHPYTCFSSKSVEWQVSPQNLLFLPAHTPLGAFIHPVSSVSSFAKWNRSGTKQVDPNESVL